MVFVIGAFVDFLIVSALSPGVFGLWLLLSKSGCFVRSAGMLTADLYHPTEEDIANSILPILEGGVGLPRAT